MTGVQTCALPISSRHQTRSGRTAGRADLEVDESHTAFRQSIQVRRLENRIAVPSEIAVTLIIADDENNIRSRALKFGSLKSRIPGENAAEKRDQEQADCNASLDPTATGIRHGTSLLEFAEG